MTDLLRSGKVRAIGTSTFPASQIVEAQWVAERRGLARFRTEQSPCSILDRGIEREVLPTCRRYGMGVFVWSPLAGGMLTGRYRKDQQSNTHRDTYGFAHMSNERRLDAIDAIVPPANAVWLIAKPSGPTIPTSWSPARRSPAGDRHPPPMSATSSTPAASRPA